MIHIQMKLETDTQIHAFAAGLLNLVAHKQGYRGAHIQFVDEAPRPPTAPTPAAPIPPICDPTNYADPEQAPADTKPKRGRPKNPVAVAPAPNAPPPAPAAGATPETPSAAKDAPAAPLTVKDAKDALSALVERSSLTVGMEALSRFGATRISELKPEQWAEFIDFCANMNAPAPVAA